MNDFDITFFLMHNVFDEFSLNCIANDNDTIDITKHRNSPNYFTDYLVSILEFSNINFDTNIKKVKNLFDENVLNKLFSFSAKYPKIVKRITKNTNNSYFFEELSKALCFCFTKEESLMSEKEIKSVSDSFVSSLYVLLTIFSNTKSFHDKNALMQSLVFYPKEFIKSESKLIKKSSSTSKPFVSSKNKNKGLFY
ncbi:MAG: hypothetical protein WC148_06030 [Bacilli bacterium]